MIHQTDITPEIGMAATLVYFSDRHAATVVNVLHNGAVVHVQRDIATRIDRNGQSERQDYTYAPDPEAPVQVFTKRKNGRYVRRGESLNSGTRLGLGYRREYYDPSF